MKVVTTTDLDRYDDLVGRLYHETRFTRAAREVALALAWAIYRDPERLQPNTGTLWNRTGRLLGGVPGKRDTWHHRRAVDADIPRYTPPQRWAGPCEGPRLRAYRPRPRPQPHRGIVYGDHGPVEAFGHRVGPGKHVTPPTDPAREAMCGVSTSHRDVIDYDPTTGWVQAYHWFCARHKDRATEVEAQVLATHGPRPTVVPNTGGVLPVYFPTWDWVKIYKWARSWWEPGEYGVNADEWPTPTRAFVPAAPRLSVVADLDPEAPQ